VKGAVKHSVVCPYQEIACPVLDRNEQKTCGRPFSTRCWGPGNRLRLRGNGDRKLSIEHIEQ
jgi:hypothetical protein